jgi:hypothetical protein
VARGQCPDIELVDGGLAEDGLTLIRGGVVHVNSDSDVDLRFDLDLEELRM